MLIQVLMCEYFTIILYTYANFLFSTKRFKSGVLLVSYEYINDKVSKGDKDLESIQSSTTPDPGYQWESDKLTVRHHKREPRGQPFPSRSPQSTYNRRAQTHSKSKAEKNTKDKKRSTALERSVKYCTGELNPVL